MADVSSGIQFLSISSSSSNSSSSPSKMSVAENVHKFVYADGVTTWQDVLDHIKKHRGFIPKSEPGAMVDVFLKEAGCLVSVTILPKQFPQDIANHHFRVMIGSASREVIEKLDHTFINQQIPTTVTVPSQFIVPLCSHQIVGIHQLVKQVVLNMP
jgi:hypothetical protein